MSRPPQRALVAVPVRDEADRIEDCLRAIALQSDVQAHGVVLVVNNSTDGTASVVRAIQPLLPVPLTLLEVDFAPAQACAGSARRLAMDYAAAGLGDGDVLLTTDADGRVPADWVAANLWHVRSGVDAVAGRAVLDPAEAALIPERLHDDDAKECAYAAALDELAALLDPLPWDPPPRHTEHSGASIAVTAAAYRRVGGMPAAPLAEDRRFFEALQRTDCRVRHAPEIAVVVSGRTVGRAEGGMADTIRRRLTAPDPYLDSALEPAATAARRARLRHRFRRLHAGLPGSGGLAAGLAADLGLGASAVETACAGRYFGEGWAALEAASPALRRVAVPAAHVQAELAAARRLRAVLGAGIPSPTA